MSNEVFPSDVRGLTFTVLRSPEFSTITQKSPSFYETRIQQSINPLWHWQLIYEYLYDDPANILSSETFTDFRVLMGFYLARGGSYDDFLYQDPDDHSVGPAVIVSTPNAQAELPLVHDTTTGNYYSPLQRIMGEFSEDITDLDTRVVTPQFYGNGTLISSSHYTIAGPGLVGAGFSYAGLYLAWNSGYVPATPVTAQFNFYFRVHFEEDLQDFEKFMGQLWTIGGQGSKNGSGYIKLVTSRITS